MKNSELEKAAQALYDYYVIEQGESNEYLNALFDALEGRKDND